MTAPQLHASMCFFAMVTYKHLVGKILTCLLVFLFALNYTNTPNCALYMSSIHLKNAKGTILTDQSPGIAKDMKINKDVDQSMDLNLISALYLKLFWPKPKVITFILGQCVLNSVLFKLPT